MIILKRFRQNDRTYCLIKCYCNNEKVIREDVIKSNETKSCGCYRKEYMKKSRTGVSPSNKTHSETHKSVEWGAWTRMKTRCLNKNNKDYPDYGGRGIIVCNRWLESYENFLNDMGRRPAGKYSLDRINVNGNYEPLNCRWATDKEQANNKRKYKKLFYEN